MRSAIFLLLVLVIATPSLAEPSDYVADVDAWHANRIEGLEKPDGWLTLVGLFALPEGSNRFGSADDCDQRLEGEYPEHIAHLEVTGTSVVLHAEADVRVDGDAVTKIELAADISGAPTMLESGSLLFYLIIRDEKPYLRVKDREAELLKHFDGIDRWPVTMGFRSAGRWIAYEKRVAIKIPSVLGYNTDYDCPGELRFEIDGQAYSLKPTSVDEESMFFVFGDATNGKESYGAGRFLVTDAPAEDGSVTIDFNRSYNPPCVFTPFATCPLPPKGNTLDIAITAGEKMFGEAH